MRGILYTSLILFQALFVCSQSLVLRNYLEEIKSEDLRIHLEVLASDGYEGRFSGTPGQKLAANYIATNFKKIGLEMPYKAKSLEGYYQKFFISRDSLKPKRRKMTKRDFFTENVLGVVSASEKTDECIVISAHYDHIGKRPIHYHNDSIAKTEKPVVFNGADDDGSGTVALLEIADAFIKAKKEGKLLKKNILIIAFSGEEIGLLGSKYYSKHSVFTMENTIANLNVDMIGRVDKKHDTLSKQEYVYLIGSDRISSDLKKINQKQNDTYIGLDLDFSFDTNDVNRYYYRSDHYNFAKHDVPVTFYFNGTHEDYHKETDEIEKINFNLLEKRTRLIFSVAWELASREVGLKKDNLKKSE